MRIARMGYTQRVTKKNKRGRITSSWERVRIVVPDGALVILAVALYRQEEPDQKSQQ